MAERARREPQRVAVVGVLGDLDGLDGEARALLASATLVAAAPPRLEALRLLAPSARAVALTSPLERVLEAVADARRRGERAVVLASGDPGFFGVGRLLARHLGPDALEVHPAPSAVAVAFARLGLPWDDALVVSAHGRPLSPRLAALAAAPKAAVLTGPDCPPEAVGTALLAAGATDRRVVVASDLATPKEALTPCAGLAELAERRWPARSVVVLLSGDPISARPAATFGPADGVGGPGPASAAADAAAGAEPLRFGLDESLYEHEAGLVTKAEVRAVALARLELPSTGLFADLGAGSGSVAIEAKRLRPGLRVVAVERSGSRAALVRANAARHGAAVEVLEDNALDALRRLPALDRAFVGGGGLEVLEAALARLAPGGRAVAAFASPLRALSAAERLGSLVELHVARGRRLPDGAFRLVGLDPVFLAWGP